MFLQMIQIPILTHIRIVDEKDFQILKNNVRLREDCKIKFDGQRTHPRRDEQEKGYSDRTTSELNGVQLILKSNNKFSRCQR